MEKGSSVVIFGLGAIGMAVLSPFQKVLHLLFSVCFPRKYIHAPHQLSFGGGINRLQRERKCVVLLGLLVWIPTQTNLNLVISTFFLCG